MYGSSAVVFILCAIITVENYPNIEYNCPEFEKKLCTESPSYENQDIYECIFDYNCGYGRKCCNHCRYGYKICTEIGLKKYAIDNHDYLKDKHCPRDKPCTIPLKNDFQYYCLSDDVCPYGSKCCRNSCYTHMVCVAPIDNAGNEIIPLPTTLRFLRTSIMNESRGFGSGYTDDTTDDESGDDNDNRFSSGDGHEIEAIRCFLFDESVIHIINSSVEFSGSGDGFSDDDDGGGDDDDDNSSGSGDEATVIVQTSSWSQFQTINSTPIAKPKSRPFVTTITKETKFDRATPSPVEFSGSGDGNPDDDDDEEEDGSGSGDHYDIIEQQISSPPYVTPMSTNKEAEIAKSTGFNSSGVGLVYVKQSRSSLATTSSDFIFDGENNYKSTNADSDYGLSINEHVTPLLTAGFGTTTPAPTQKRVTTEVYSGSSNYTDEEIHRNVHKRPTDMSYPGYPPYQQAPGMPGANSAPYPTQPTYPPYPGGGAPYPSNTMPYPQQGGVYPPSLGFSSNSPMYMPPPSYPGAPPSQGSYPGAPPSQGAYPGATPSQGAYPGATPSQGAYPGAPPSQGSYPSQSQPPYPGAQQVYPSQQQPNYGPPTGSGGSTRPPTGSYPNYSPAHGGGHGGGGSTPDVIKRKTPTVVPAQPFDPRGDAEILRRAMKGFGTDEKAIISVLAKRTNSQRLEIAVHFKTMYGKDLIKDLKSELSGRFEDLAVAMMTPLPQYYARELHDAVCGAGTDEDCLIEVLCTLSNHEIRTIRNAYQTTYGASLEQDLRGDTGGHFKRLMTSLCSAGRDESGVVNQGQAQADAQQLLQAGVMQWGTDESAFNMILCHRNYNQLKLVFDEYQRVAGHDIEQAIKGEFSGDIQQGLLAIVRSVRNLPGFFAKRLQQSMSGMGTSDGQLIRIILTRSEMDMGEIKQHYAAQYGKSLAEAIADDTSGDYKKCLLALIGEY